MFSPLMVQAAWTSRKSTEQSAEFMQSTSRRLKETSEKSLRLVGYDISRDGILVPYLRMTTQCLTPTLIHDYHIFYQSTIIPVSSKQTLLKAFQGQFLLVHEASLCYTARAFYCPRPSLRFSRHFDERWQPTQTRRFLEVDRIRLNVRWRCREVGRRRL